MALFYLVFISVHINGNSAPAISCTTHGIHQCKQLVLCVYLCIYVGVCKCEHGFYGLSCFITMQTALKSLNKSERGLNLPWAKHWEDGCCRDRKLALASLLKAIFLFYVQGDLVGSWNPAGVDHCYEHPDRTVRSMWAYWELLYWSRLEASFNTAFSLCAL